MRHMSTLSAILSLTPRHRSRLIASTMLALIAIVFAVNGRAPGGVNLRPRDLSQTISLADERPLPRNRHREDEKVFGEDPIDLRGLARIALRPLVAQLERDVFRLVCSLRL